MLRAWIAWGQGCASKEEHKAIWSRVCSAKKKSKLPSLEALLAMPVFAPVSGAASASAAGTGKQSSATEQSSAVANSAPRTPDEVTERMEAMIAAGQLPRTTKAQRRRNKRTNNTEYGVPQGLSEALQWGFVHPNLPPPRGMQWVASGLKQFTLQYRGG